MQTVSYILLPDDSSLRFFFSHCLIYSLSQPLCVSVLEIFLSVPPNPRCGAVVPDMHTPHTAFPWMLRIFIQGLMLVQQMLLTDELSPSPDACLDLTTTFA